MNTDLRLCIIDDLPCVVRGPQTGPRLLVVQPLFEEMNRSRRLLAQITANLAGMGIGSWMPDLPGTGDASGRMDWAGWQRTLLAFHAKIQSETIEDIAIFAMRGGALLTSEFPRRYLLAPAESGASLLRNLLRTRAAASQESVTERVDALAERLESEPLDLAGYWMTPALAKGLESAALSTKGAHIARIGDGGFVGPPVWQQGEPADATAMAADIATDIAAWLAT